MRDMQNSVWRSTGSRLFVAAVLVLCLLCALSPANANPNSKPGGPNHAPPPPAFPSSPSSPSSSATDDQCNLTTSAGCAPTGSVITNKAPCNQTPGMPNCDAVRSDPGVAAFPIDVANYCRYVDNATGSGKSIFVPFHSSTEWMGFVSNVQSTNNFISLVRCARSDNTQQVPANYATYPNGTANPFHIALPAPNDTTCAAAQAVTVNLPYARVGTVMITGRGTLPAVSFTCTVPGYSCFPNGGACGTNQTWTEVATATFTANASADGSPTPSGWRLTGVTYSGTKPVIQTNCTATPETWSVNGVTCSGTASAANSGTSVSVISTNGYTGAANYQCTNGVFSETAGTCSVANVNGVCGADNGAALSSNPTNLCSAGTASALMSISGGWSWSCVGVGSGTTVNCSASSGAGQCTCPAGMAGTPPNNCFYVITNPTCLGNTCQFAFDATNTTAPSSATITTAQALCKAQGYSIMAGVTGYRHSNCNSCTYRDVTYSNGSIQSVGSTSGCNNCGPITEVLCTNNSAATLPVLVNTSTTGKTYAYDNLNVFSTTPSTMVNATNICSYNGYGAAMGESGSLNDNCNSCYYIHNVGNSGSGCNSCGHLSSALCVNSSCAPTP